MSETKENISPPLPSIQFAPPTPNTASGLVVANDTSLLNSNDVQLSSLPPTLEFDQPEQEQNNGIVRAGLNPKPRVVLMTCMGGFWGFAMGGFLGGRQSGLQYLAENAHKLPTTVQGWYFYHKTKNYRMMLGGIKKGVQYAGKTGGLCLLYSSLEAGLDDVRGEADVFNSVGAGITTGAIFSALTRLTRGSFRYSVMFGAVFGLAAGGLSDLHKYVSGDTPTYGIRISSLFKKQEIEESRAVKE